MKELNIKLVLPYNWWHARNIKVYDENKKLLTKIRHGEFKQLEIPDSITKIVVKVDLLSSEIELPLEVVKCYVILYLDFRDRFFVRYVDIFKRKCLTGRIVERKEFEYFWVDFYAKSSRLIKPAVLNRPNLILGMILSSGITVLSVVEQENPYKELLFLIGLGSLISLIMVWVQQGQIQQFDYRLRTVATGFAFFLAICCMQAGFAIKFLFIVFSFIFFMRITLKASTAMDNSVGVKGNPNS